MSIQKETITRLRIYARNLRQMRFAEAKALADRQIEVNRRMLAKHDEFMSTITEEQHGRVRFRP